MDDIARKMAAVQWSYGGRDPVALAELEQRIAEAGRKLGMVTYSDLVKGVTFRLPNVKRGQPFQINVYEWSGLDRAVLGEFLGYISTRSYREHGFMASALVVNKAEYKPSDHFFQWMKTLDVLPDLEEDTVLRFWIEHVNKAHTWYAARRR